MDLTFVLDARTATAHFPGIGRYVSSLARALVPALGGDEGLVLLRDPARSSLSGPTIAEGPALRVEDVPITPFSLRQQWALPSLLRRLGADVYHSCYYLMPYGPGVPTVLTVYDLIPLLFPRQVSLRARLLFRWATALALRSAACVIAISEATRRDLLRAFDVRADLVAAIPLAAGAEFYPRSAQEAQAVRSRYSLPDRYLLFVGSNKPHKNLTRLVQAWAQVGDSSPSGAGWRLVVAGSWDERYSEPRRRAEDLGLGGGVLWLGRVAEEDLPALYTGAGAFVSPSLYEGFGLPVLEAMACGVPAACSDCPGLTEVAGDAALTFNATSVESISASLQRLVADAGLRAELRERGLRRAARFSWEETARRTLAVYREVSARSEVRRRSAEMSVR